ncbi:MAG: phosphatidylserine decarboxylase [Planctomycetes bacterium]|nr:phosphatidylserine decarboxylase [Planctomycetota bacterium]
MPATPLTHPHPPELVRIDRFWIVPWGLRTIAWLVAVALLLLAAVLTMALALGASLALLAAAPVLAFFWTGVWFFRNPPRRIPQEEGVLVAPADGKVLEIAVVEEQEYLRGPALRLTIFLSIFNVHVNRAPASGRVQYLQYRPGRFLDARNPSSARENESQSIGLVLAGMDQRLLVRQISGAIARRIICPLARGQEVARGGLIGMIKYGSRTEIYVSRAAAAAGRFWQPAVGAGARVRGGATILFRLEESS